MAGQRSTTLLEYIQKNSIDTIPDKDRVISILFHRIGTAISECYFGNINVLIISLLAELASVASLNHLMQPGLYESMYVLFLNNDVTCEKAVEFLDRFFDRPDIDNVLEDVIMVTIVNMANYSPPSPPFWRFMCKFMYKFGEKIEKMSDFSAVESSGLLPIFTRSLIWDYRNIYQHPPEKEHEEVFWLMWKSILTRYKEAILKNPVIINLNSDDKKDEKSEKNNEESDDFKDKDPVIQLFYGLMNEIRLSVYFSQKSAQKEGQYLSNTPLEVLKLLYQIDGDGLMSFLESQFESEQLRITLQALNNIAEGGHKSRVEQMLSKY
ncbi:hypothetical protein TRFO_11874 [Tritrichomonas foetus]|uniref:Uncharacterized protein n=1 Tax=Tritrichomonas foetus TaxID=1144522 RepID=A0A1J4J0X5_9EUKA|nr:hypothetical protein TRFO_11874 [Tritrichomonas foetus]|eukprot:OHS93270.1 hypothetical protein TRFO_11874 [Tritrichomonas foetus]